MRSAQTSIEYLAVAAILTAVIVPTVYVFYGYTHESAQEVIMAQVDSIGRDLVDAVEHVNSLGYPSRITLEILMPEGVDDIQIWDDGRTLVFIVLGGTEMVFHSRVKMQGNIECHDDDSNRCSSKFLRRFSTPGIKHVSVQAHHTHVLIYPRFPDIDDDYDEDFPYNISRRFIPVYIDGNFHSSPLYLAAERLGQQVDYRIVIGHHLADALLHVVGDANFNGTLTTPEFFIDDTLDFGSMVCDSENCVLLDLSNNRIQRVEDPGFNSNEEDYDWAVTKGFVDRCFEDIDKCFEDLGIEID